MAKKSLTLEEKLEEAIVKDAPYKVPENWVLTELGKICSFHQGLQVPKDIQYDNDKENRIRFIRIVDYTQSTEDIRYIDMPTDNANYFVKSNDIVMVRYGTIGNIGRGIEGIIANNMFKIAPNNKIVSKEYLYVFLRSAEVYDFLVKSSSSSTMPAINFKVVSSIKICIPPLKEQQRIVHRIESLFEKLDKAKELIEEARDDFEKRRAAILEKAFRGELTKEWREKNTNLVYGEDYLKSISKERNRVFSCSVEESKKNKSKKPTKIHNIDLEYEKLNNCETWIKTKLYNVLYDFRYGTSSKSDYTFEGSPVIRIPNLSNGYITHIDIKYLKESDIDANNKVKIGDIVIVRSNGSPLLVGKTSLITELENDFAFASYLIRMRPCGIDSKYLYYVLNSVGVKEQFYSKSKSTSGINNINTEELGNSYIPLPPLEEQKEIVRILDKLLEEESKIEELTQLEDGIELMKKSILAKAFRGELGTNCEEDESALELLKEALNT